MHEPEDRDDAIDDADGADPGAGDGGDDAGAAEAQAPESPPVAEPTEAELLRGRLDDANARLRTVSKAYTDLQAEMHSFRERLEHQAKARSERQAFDMARTFFDPVQNLKRSLASQTQDPADLRRGVEMVLHQFMEALHKLGLEPVPGVGADFDPRFHEALALAPVTDPAMDGKVLAVHADGYLVGGKALQAAQVVVGKYQEPAGEA